MKNCYFIGNINPTFSDKPKWSSPSLGGQTHQRRLRPASRSREGGEGRGGRMPQGTRRVGGWGCWGCAVSSKNGLSWSKSLKSLKFISLLYILLSVFLLKGIINQARSKKPPLKYVDMKRHGTLKWYFHFSTAVHGRVFAGWYGFPF